MIIPDLNLLVYAYNEDAPHHLVAREWWAKVIGSGDQIALPWIVVNGFLRLMSNRAVLVHPLTPSEALDRVEEWFAQRNVQAIEPGPRYLEILKRIFRDRSSIGSELMTDAHIAALAIEYNAEVHSNDMDFGRFTGLKWKNPLV
ncbi:MAG: type II toxin-antitoxin system VapC family toxin [Deltaproteobacteria bacterium]|nr:type II toxin-antitoxin system VapC family toxin [Deltaproteobacteria bacterium]